MTQDSPFAHTSCDLRQIVGPNTDFPRISIAGRQYEVVAPSDARTVTLGDTYCGSTKVYKGVERIEGTKKKNAIDYSQDWIRLEKCMVRVLHGSDVAWADCDLSAKDSTIDGALLDFFCYLHVLSDLTFPCSFSLFFYVSSFFILFSGGADNGECVRIDCNQYTLIDGGGEYNEGTKYQYEEKRTCKTTFERWKGNMATSEGKEMEEEEMVLPQHTVVVETATAGKEVEKATKRIKKNREISKDNNNKKEESEVDNIESTIEEELVKSVEEFTLLEIYGRGGIGQSSRNSVRAAAAAATSQLELRSTLDSNFPKFRGNDQISLENLKDAAVAMRAFYQRRPTRRSTKRRSSRQMEDLAYLALTRVRTRTQLLAALQSVVVGLSPRAILRSVDASANIDVSDM